MTFSYPWLLLLLAGPAVHLTWKDTSSAEHHFSIERKTGSGAFAEIATELLNKDAHHDANVQSGMTYTYRVAAVKESLLLCLDQ